MAMKSTAASQVAVKKENTFKEVLTFADTDVVSYSSFSLKPENETITRDYRNAKTLLSGKPLQGKSSSSGSVTLEVVPDATDSKLLDGTVLYEAALGKYTTNGATIDADKITDKIAAADGDAGVYYLSDASDGINSVGIKYVIGGDAATSVDVRGVVIDSFKLNFPPQGIITAEFGVKGSTGFIPVATAALTDHCSAMTPHVARSMTVEVNGASYCASDLSFEVDNGTQDFDCVTTNGAGDKTLTERTVKGSFKVAFEDLNEINAFNASTDMRIFAKATSLDGKEFAVYIPVATRTSLDIGDDSGSIVQTIEFDVSSECGGTSAQPIMIAAK